MLENKDVLSVLQEMEDFESKFDSKFAVDKLTGDFLYQFILDKEPYRILELGTWRGTSAIYMAAAFDKLGRGELVTVDIGNDRVEQASKNFIKSGVGNYITQVIDNINNYLPNDLTLYDLVFMDARKDQQGKWLQRLVENNLQTGSFVIVDDAVLMEDQISDLFNYVQDNPSLKGDIIHIDDGLFVIEVL